MLKQPEERLLPASPIHATTTAARLPKVWRCRVVPSSDSSTDAKIGRTVAFCGKPTQFWILNPGLTTWSLTAKPRNSMWMTYSTMDPTYRLSMTANPACWTHEHLRGLVAIASVTYMSQALMMWCLGRRPSRGERKEKQQRRRHHHHHHHHHEYFQPPKNHHSPKKTNRFWSSSQEAVRTAQVA